MRRISITQLYTLQAILALLLLTGGNAFASSHSHSSLPSKLEERSRQLALKVEDEAQNVTRRLHHAKELLGKFYQKSIVKASEGIANLDEVILQWTDRALKGKWKSASKKVSKAILVESEKYGFDPIFLMAVIENESSFNPDAKGSHGEIGLMQLTPDTAKWVTLKYNLPWHGPKSLKDPTVNIQIGSAYLAYLREKFDFHSQLYLAAYNMGTLNVKRALGKQIWPKDYPTRVMQRYVRFYSELTEDTEETVN